MSELTANEATALMAAGMYASPPTEAQMKDGIERAESWLAQREREVKAEALREVADAMDNGDIEHDELKYDTTDAPKGWVDSCVLGAWESMSIWAPWLRNRADRVESGSQS